MPIAKRQSRSQLRTLQQAPFARRLTLKRFLTHLLALLALSGAALASPAQDLFDQAVYLLTINYGGFSSTTPKALAAQYQTEIDQACADQVDACPFERAHPVIARMLEALKDGHSAFLPKNDFGLLNSLIFGTAKAQWFTGLFTVPAKRSASRIVLDVAPGSPAANAGLRRGDRIVAVNNQALSRFEQPGALLATGQGEQPLQLLVLRAGTSLRATITPTQQLPVPGPSLTVRDDGVALLRIPTFLVQGLGAQVHALVREAQNRNAKALILDLRDNGGGLIVEYVNVVAALTDDPGRRFDSPNPLRQISLRLQNGKLRQNDLELDVPELNARWTGRLVVLVNQHSASAAEFTAHDLQRYANATVIGEPTYGIGNTMTATFPLEDGTGLLITLAKALRPDGTPYPERVTPNIAVADDLEALNRTGRDAVLEQALETLR